MTSVLRTTPTLNTSLIADGQFIDAADVLTPFADVITALIKAQQYVAVTTNDANMKNLNDAIVVTGGVTKTLLNSGADEQLQFGLDLSSPPAIGATAPNAGTFKPLTVTGTVTSGTRAFTVNASVTNTDGIAFFPTVTTNVSGTALITGQATLVPSTGLGFLYGLLFIPSLASSSSNVTNLMGILARTDTAASYSGTIGSAYAIYAANPSKAGGTMTNVYGLYIESLTSGTNNYAILTNSGLVQFGDQLAIVGSANRIQLLVRASGSQSARLVEHQASGGGFVSGVAANGRFINATNAGAPTGTPDNGTTVYDTTNNRLYVYNGAWKSVVLS